MKKEKKMSLGKFYKRVILIWLAIFVNVESKDILTGGQGMSSLQFSLNETVT
jgi:hypothetical protein